MGKQLLWVAVKHALVPADLKLASRLPCCQQLDMTDVSELLQKTVRLAFDQEQHPFDGVVAELLARCYWMQ